MGGGIARIGKGPTMERVEPRLGKGSAIYEWLGLVNSEDTSVGWAHHGVAVTESGRIVAFDALGDDVLVFTASGEPISRWSSGLSEGHGITMVVEDDREYVWIADPGQKMKPTSPGTYEPVTMGQHGRVVKFTLDGRLVHQLPVPSVPVYEDHRYSPTAVAVDAPTAGGSGQIWVADGYGESLVHLFDADGTYVRTLQGPFNCPHGLLIDRRRGKPELYVADRENGRLQVYNLDGELCRTVGEGVLRRPSALATSRDLLIVAELEARLAVFDLDDNLVCYLGADDEASNRPGWPNALTPEGRTVRPTLNVGRFNSPHGLATDAEGNLVVVEWLIGGRVTRLQKES
jgi:DNA-binding beta-propeller fold protein YncE